MPPLANLKHEKFVNLVIMGVAAGRAYEQAGYKSRGNVAEVSAHNLLRNPKVKCRFEELHSTEVAKILNDMGATVQRRVAVLIEGMYADKAVSVVTGKDAGSGGVDFVDVPDWAARLKAVDLLNKMGGVYIERSEHSERREIIINGEVVVVEGNKHAIIDVPNVSGD